MEKKYYLVKFDSEENYYKCTALYKAENEKTIKEYYKNNLASDMYIVSIEQVDYLLHTSEVMAKVSPECKIYSDYIEI